MIYDIIWNLNYFIKRPLNSISLVIIKEGEPSKTTNSPSYDKNVLKSNLLIFSILYSKTIYYYHIIFTKNAILFSTYKILQIKPSEEAKFDKN